MSIAQRFKDIADAIREKTGGVDPITPLQMPGAIRGIQTGLVTMTEAAWDALSTEEKQALGVVGIIQTSSGYNRGIIVNGEDYIPPTELLSSLYRKTSGETTTIYTATESRTISIVLLYINTEASTKTLNITCYKNDSELSVEASDYHTYTSSSTNTRNYRLVKLSAEVAEGDAITVETSEGGGYTALIAFITTYNQYNTIDTIYTTNDASTSYSTTFNGLVFYGSVNNSRGIYNLDFQYLQNEGTTISADIIATGYGTSFIIYFT